MARIKRLPMITCALRAGRSACAAHDEAREAEAGRPGSLSAQWRCSQVWHQPFDPGLGLGPDPRNHRLRPAHTG